MKDDKCECCDGQGYLEVATEAGYENQWCQECITIEPDYDPPNLGEEDKPCDKCADSMTGKLANESCPHCGFTVPF